MRKTFILTSVVLAMLCTACGNTDTNTTTDLEGTTLGTSEPTTTLETTALEAEPVTVAETTEASSGLSPDEMLRVVASVRDYVYVLPGYGSASEADPDGTLTDAMLDALDSHLGGLDYQPYEVDDGTYEYDCFSMSYVGGDSGLEDDRQLYATVFDVTDLGLEAGNCVVSISWYDGNVGSGSAYVAQVDDLEGLFTAVLGELGAESETTTTTEETTVTTSESETSTESVTEATTTEYLGGEVQLTPTEMLDEMAASNGALYVASSAGFGGGVYCTEAESVESYLSGVDYTRVSSADVLSDDGLSSWVSLTLEYQDLFGNPCCTETFTVYDASSAGIDGANCVVTVYISDPDGSLYHDSFESYTAYVSDLDGLFRAFESMEPYEYGED